ncbi:pseudouridine synthase [Lysobacter concretionis Ko07 = DSM 16239]|uniref:tRNA pseudouridine synthase D n=1 Tax=Lysobacter concretionis Ko07 = DSM 16239 TaxID=1122185 RepID=A0A0A0EQU6_9GAMM|nr:MULTISPECIES: tRNA pseudouridine(13) synthase TruD [Lysobacter]KGM52533.1 pseudouridine synthase [Lysobacter concretionis Ko07 = DSM 16239]QOD91713.1 tRNA pseudouridine(13) synthase TruD [Lysobacter sp. CW239]
MSERAAGPATTASPCALGPPVLSARIRTSPEDFFVEELPGFEPGGSGEHLLLTVEKRGMNTAFAARRIAQWAGVGDMAIGYAGLKDRHAVTRQRFSVHLPKKIAPDLATLGDEDLKVLEHHWHGRKLPRGALAGNRFVLVLRDVEGERDAIESRLADIAARGVPNYFGEQRFGHGGDNIGQALAMFAGRRVRREERGMLLSAARSALFNQVLAARVAGGCWDTPLEGEVWMLDGSRSVFGPEPFNDILAQRLAAFDIHPSGPLWGSGELRSAGESAALERAAVADEVSAQLRQGLEHAGLKQERRALRLHPGNLAWRWPDSATLELGFSLPPGTYATVVLAELGAIRESTPPSVRA